MARARLVGPIKARKEFTCATCDKSFVEGSTKYVVESFRRRTSFCAEHKPTPDRVAAMAPKSRADRASDAAGEWTNAAESLRQLSEQARAVAAKLSAANAADGHGGVVGGYSDLDSDVADLRADLANVSVDTSEVESLCDEMESWRDNMEEHFGSTSKYDEVSEAADALEEFDSLPDLPSLDEHPTEEDLEAFADECVEVASELEDRAGVLLNVSFPTMF